MSSQSAIGSVSYKKKRGGRFFFIYFFFFKKKKEIIKKERGPLLHLPACSYDIHIKLNSF
jgi:hypothetical protein